MHDAPTGGPLPRLSRQVAIIRRIPGFRTGIWWKVALALFWTAMVFATAIDLIAEGEDPAAVIVTLPLVLAIGPAMVIAFERTRDNERIRTAGANLARTVRHWAEEQQQTRCEPSGLQRPESPHGPPLEPASPQVPSNPTGTSPETAPSDHYTTPRASTFGQAMTWQQAEQLAQRWMRAAGYTDARVTPGGADGGIDVMASEACAQVKQNWSGPVGRPDVQRLSGIARHHELTPLFFALADTGYSRAAIDWATDAEVALLTYTTDGQVQPANRVARQLVAVAASRGPLTPIDSAVVERRGDLAVTIDGVTRVYRSRRSRARAVAEHLR